MTQQSLTSRYRPQTFANVAGQQATKTILSRAATQDKIAPAYLFSGTRGVGKTTIARIFAKALNCAEAPSPEPCNKCHFCRQITRGACADVMEIDGASNNGVEHVRRLTEEVAYAPLECRYKVIIIDEAHMLSRAAFNALLKTLEEPPAHALFIMATTEPEKFPATIISRCQHYVFKSLSLQELYAHLSSILQQENIEFEEAGLNLIARRGAGSVRDSMSLLSQVLALGEKKLDMEQVRSILGLAGPEILLTVLECIFNQDILRLHGVIGQMLEQGLDIGFFLRELVVCWRNLFLLSQTGDQAAEIIDLPQAEMLALTAWAKKFSLQRIHASWQLTLEGQRKVLHSLEPALALEMLLLNLTYLPRLLPIEKVPGQEVQPQEKKKSDPQTVQPIKAGAQSATSTPLPEKASPSPDLQLVADNKDWAGFIRFCLVSPGGKQAFPGIKRASGKIEGQQIKVICQFNTLYEDLVRHSLELQTLAKKYFGENFHLELIAPAPQKRVSLADLRKQAEQHQLIKDIQEEFQARILDVQPLDNK